MLFLQRVRSVFFGGVVMFGQCSSSFGYLEQLKWMTILMLSSWCLSAFTVFDASGTRAKTRKVMVALPEKVRESLLEITQTLRHLLKAVQPMCGNSNRWVTGQSGPWS